MDDFHRELNSIKQRVALYGHITPQAAPEDMFSDDLAALKARLQSMEDSLNLLNASQNHREAQHIQPMWNAPSLPSALPSGPLFWQLFTSLRTDVRGLDSRVADVEQNLSNLEDRMDTLDPNRFTPPGSNTTQTSVPWTSNQSFAAFGQQAAELPCDYQYQQYSNPAWYSRPISQPRGDFSGNVPYCGTRADPTRWSETSTGIAFRDREITRLEDMLNRMQNDIQDSEDVVNHKNTQIDQLNYQQEGLHNQVAELQQTVRAYNNIFAMNRKEFESQQAGFYDKKSQLEAAESKVLELQYALSIAGGSSQTTIDEAVAEKENELSKLREFADRKDEVVRQQGGVIARGAKIIRERDDTIDRLSKELKISVDDCRNESRERERCSRLLEEKTAEIAQLKDELAPTEMVPGTPRTELASSNFNVETPEKARPLPITPLAFDAQQNHRQKSGQWTPQTLGKFKLPHEQRRAAAWETTSGPIALDGAKFGQAGQISLKRTESLKLLEKLALVEEGHRTKSPAQPCKPRYSLPLDHLERHNKQGGVCSKGGLTLADTEPVSDKQHTIPANASSLLACETPPALPPRLLRSRNDDGDGHAVPASRHQPKPLSSGRPRRSLQAYVEADDSREKRGDAA